MKRILSARKNSYILFGAIAIVLIISILATTLLNNFKLALANSDEFIYTNPSTGLQYSIVSKTEGTAKIVGVNSDSFNAYLSTNKGKVDLDNAFYYENVMYTTTEIGEKAFYDSPLLSQVILPSKLEVIGKQAFHGCISLTKIVIPSTLKEIKERAFSYCTALHTIDFESDTYDGLFFGPKAFENCSSLTEIEFPNGTAENPVILSTALFHNCISLRNIIISENVNVLKAMENNLNALLFGAPHELSVYYLVPDNSEKDSKTDQNSDLRAGISVYDYLKKAIPEKYLKVFLLSYSNGTIKLELDCPATLTIPESIGSHKITAIDSLACEACSNKEKHFDHSGVKTIIFPSNIKEIPCDLFYNCSNLVNIVGAPGKFTRTTNESSVPTFSSNRLKSVYFDSVYSNAFASLVSTNSSTNFYFTGLIEEENIEVPNNVTFVNSLKIEQDYISNSAKQKVIEKNYFLDISDKNISSETPKNIFNITSIPKNNVVSDSIIKNDFNVEHCGDVPYIWTITDIDLFTVNFGNEKSDNGFLSRYIVGIQKYQSGSAILTATSIDGKYTFKYKINVYATPTLAKTKYNKTVDLQSDSVGKTFSIFDENGPFKLSLKHEHGLEVNAPITWASSNKSVASIGNFGDIKINSSGYTQITAIIGGYLDNKTIVEIDLFVYGVNFENSSIEIKKSNIKPKTYELYLDICLPSNSQNSMEELPLNLLLEPSINELIDIIKVEIKDGNSYSELIPDENNSYHFNSKLINDKYFSSIKVSIKSEKFLANTCQLNASISGYESSDFIKLTDSIKIVNLLFLDFNFNQLGSFVDFFVNIVTELILTIVQLVEGNLPSIN